jgi:hypothetical protein
MERKLVKVACPVVDGNPDGYYMQYEDEMKEGEVLFDAKLTDPAANKIEPKIDPTKLNLQELRDVLVGKQISFPANGSKAELLKILAAAEASTS